MRLIINFPDGTQREEEYGEGGCYHGNPEDIVWNYNEDGEPPIDIELGEMSRIEKVEKALDSNKKQIYEYVLTGESKQDRKRVPVKHLAVYLKNNKTGKIKKSNKEPKRIVE